MAPLRKHASNVFQTVKELKSEETLQFAKSVMGALYQNSKLSK